MFEQYLKKGITTIISALPTRITSHCHFVLKTILLRQFNQQANKHYFIATFILNEKTII